jgi:multidrug resistance protein
MNSRKALIVLFFTIFIDLVGFGIVIPILPIYADELGANGFVLGLVTGSFSLMQFLFAPFWGNLSDRLGRRPILLISIAITAASYWLFSQSNTLFLLLLSRSLAGIGSANISAANAFISDITPPEKRAQNFGIVGAAFGLGFIFGPPIGGFLKNDFGIEWVGYTAAFLGALNFLMALFLLPESISDKSKTGPLFPNPFKEIATVLKRTDIRGFLLSNFIFITAFSMMHLTASLLWEERFDLNEKEIGYVFAFIGISVAVVQGFLIKYFKSWFGERQLYLWGAILLGIGLLAMPFVPVELFIPLELLALLVIAVGNGFFTPTVASLISQASRKGEQGKMMGLLQSIGSLSRVVGPLIGGVLYAQSASLPYIVAFFLMMATAWLAREVVKKVLPKTQ